MRQTSVTSDVTMSEGSPFLDPMPAWRRVWTVTDLTEASRVGSRPRCYYLHPQGVLLDAWARPQRGRGTPDSARCARRWSRRGSPDCQPQWSL